MNPLHSTIHADRMKKAIWIYLLVTFMVTWSIVLGAYSCYASGLLSLNGLNLVYCFGALGPVTGAWISARSCYGRQGLKKIQETLRFKGIRKKVWLLAICPLFFFTFGLLIYPLLTGRFFGFDLTIRQFGLTGTSAYLGWILPFISYSILEEFGWRAYLLPHLQSRYPAFKSSLILAVCWALWHAPFFLWRFDFSLFMAFGFFFSLTLGSLILTSLFNLSKGSIAPVILFHLMNNLTSALEREYLVAVTGAGTVFLAIYLFRTYGREHLSDLPRITDFYPQKTTYETC